MRRRRCRTAVAAAAASLMEGCAHFPQPPPTVIIPAANVGDHLYVQISLNGQRRSMLFDTGATQSFAALDGCRSGSRAQTLTYRGQSLGHLTFGCAQFGPGSFDGYPFDGLLGYDFIRRAPIHLDYDRRTIRVGAASLATGGAGNLPVKLLEDDSGGKIPIVEMTLRAGNRATVGRFILDTGARGTLVVSRRFAAQAGLDERAAREALIGGGGAVVKALRARLMRIEAIEIGHYRLDRPIVMVTTADQGIFSVPDFDGVIGGGLLNRFNLTLDYAQALIELRPSRRLRSPFTFDQSGLFLIATGPDYGTITVRDVMPNSPAARAGIKVGAIIESVAGRDVRGIGLEWIRHRLQRAGTVTLRFKQGARAQTATIALRPLV